MSKTDFDRRPRFSVIVPAYNEELYLPRVLASLDEARARYRDGPDAIEVIVADNGSTDRTAEIAEAQGCRVAHVEKRQIAAARNGGAKIARGEILCFIDADSQAHAETFNWIDEVLATGKYVGGATGIRLERLSLGLFVTLYSILALLGPFGLDAGVVFCRAQDFRTVGGYREDRDMAEDVVFLLDLRRLGRPRGQGLARGKGARAIISTRKFDAQGDWHMFFIPFAVLRHRSLSAFVRAYWYDVRD